MQNRLRSIFWQERRGPLPEDCASRSTRLRRASEASGIPLAAFHRVGAIACGGLNTLPHDGAVVTYLSYCKISHKKGYFDMFIVAGAIPIIANVVAIILGSFGIV